MSSLPKKNTHTEPPVDVEAVLRDYADNLARGRRMLAAFDADVARAMARIAAMLVVMMLAGCGGPAFSTSPAADTSGDGATTLGQGGPEAGPAADVGVDGPSVAALDDAGDGGGAVEGTQDAAQVLADATPDGARDAGPACLATLAGVGTADFSISFNITTTTQTATALVNQSASCQAACGGAASVEWDAFIQGATGLVQIETDNGTASARVYAINAAPVNDGRPHQIVASRVAGELSISVDGVSSALVADGNDLTTLPALVVGSDPCAGSSGAAGCPAVRPLADAGTLTDLCLTR